MSSIRRLQVAGMVLLAFSAGCDFTRSCTLIGCADGLRIQLDQPPAYPYRVEVSSPLFETRAIDCTAENCHQHFIWFRDYTPGVVTVKVIAGPKTVIHQAEPQYTQSRPNGPDCGPVCTGATVLVPMT